MGAGLTAPPGFLPYERPLREATYLGRRKRFFADVRLDDGTEVVAHCANTGSMMGLDVPGARCRVSHHDDPARKLAWTLEQLQVDGTWVMVHTARPNHVVEAAITAGQIPSLAGYDVLRREVRYGSQSSRIDLLLLDGGELLPGAVPELRKGRHMEPARRACFVEVKNVTLVRQGVAAFPDAVSTRALKHLEELSEVVEGGHRAVLVLHVARSDATVFRPAVDVDPAWARGLVAAIGAGVELIALACEVEATGLRAVRTLPIEA